MMILEKALLRYDQVKTVCILILLVFLLTACQSSLITDWFTRSGQPLFHDDFSNPSSGWTVGSNANGSLNIIQGAYQIQVQTSGYDLVGVSGHQYQDMRVEVDAAQVGGPISNRMGLICRYQDALHYYFFIVPADGYFAIGKMNAGSASLLGQEMMSYSDVILQGMSLNHLRFDCIGKTLAAFVNDQRIAIAVDDEFQKGDAGLLAGTFNQPSVTVAFDNFVVFKP